MLITRKDKIDKPFENSTTGKRIYEVIGRPEHLGGTTGHSFGHIVIPPSTGGVLELPANRLSTEDLLLRAPGAYPGVVTPAMRSDASKTFSQMNCFISRTPCS